MKNKDKLIEQGLKKVDAKTAFTLKENFYNEIIEKNPKLVTQGYFIGKTLLRRILLESNDAAGILISFGVNKKIEKSGQIHLVIEACAGQTKDDHPAVIKDLQKYATTAVVGDGKPDGLLPQIKPNPPH